MRGGGAALINSRLLLHVSLDDSSVPLPWGPERQLRKMAGISERRSSGGVILHSHGTVRNPLKLGVGR